MSTQKKTIFIRFGLDNGRKYGLGHGYRILNILKELNLSSDHYRLFFIINRNKISKIFLKQKLKNLSKKIIFDDLKKDTYSKFFLKYKNSYFISDNLGRDSFFFKLFLAHNKKIVSFDDIRNKLSSKSVIINSIYFLKKKLKKKFFDKGVKIYQSLKYLPLNIKSNKYQPNIKFDRIKNITITLGGSDIKKDTLKILQEIYTKNFTYYVIVGIANKDYKKIKSFSKNKKNIKVLYDIHNLESPIKKSQLIICSGGNVLFEALSYRKNCIVLKTYDHQKKTIEYFANKNCIYVPKKKITKKMILNMNKKKEITKMRENIKFIPKDLDKKGIKRICNILKKFLNE